MTREQLKRGQDIDQLIEQKREQLNYWNKAVHFDLDLGDWCDDRDWRDMFHNPAKPRQIDVVQALVVKKYEQEIAALQEEFNNL